ncbi:hypothetical protein [Pectobacterium versatile]|uniref:hypothetical protein n=1 Tax=Pectobacterium versatile TaxID=2488639 RepID=UPI002277C3BB|nr:hypothetical protein [Pectobacterium versatile]
MNTNIHTFVCVVKENNIQSYVFNLKIIQLPLINWLTGWLVNWLVGWLVGWVVGWLVGWLAGWLEINRAQLL